MTRLVRGAALTKSIKIAFLCCTVLVALAAPAQKKTPSAAHTRTLNSQSKPDDPSLNYPPPPGAILDLNGTPIPGGGNGTYQQYTVNFTASIASTAITIAFRDDPAFLSVAEVSVVDLTHPSANLLVNGDFSQGTYSNNGNLSAPIGWTFANQYGASDYGIVTNSYCSAPLPSPASFCWYDGSVQAYDALSQTITTAIGDVYQVSFFVAENSGCGCNFSDLSTNGDTTDTGGNGINVTVYAQNGLPPATQPLNVTLLDSGNGTVTDNSQTTEIASAAATPASASSGSINCSESNGVVSGSCSANYQFNQVVILTAQANTPPSSPASTFAGWGGDCPGPDDPPNQCTLTMNGTKNVTARFDIPQQTDTGSIPTTNNSPPTVYPYNGGYAQDSGGYDFTAQGSNPDPNAPTFNAVTTAIKTDSTTCDNLIAPSFPGAKCFVFQLGLGPDPSTDVPITFELTCPSPSGVTCGSTANPNFLATLGSDFSFDVSENSPLDLVNSNPNITPYGPLQASGGNPYVGYLKGEGPDPAHPCTPFPPNDTRNQTMFSNQIVAFNLVDTGTKPIKGGSSGTGSCWIPVYLAPNEVPTVAITSPANNAIFTQGQQDPFTVATYTCTTVYNGVPMATGGGYPAFTPTGPYLTGTCSAIDSPGGSVSQGGYVDTNTIGAHTLTATVLDSATNTASALVDYTVQGTQSILLSGVPASAVYGGMSAVGATGGASGSPVTFTSAGGCSNSGASYTMSSGTTPCSVIANQAGNTNYSAAPQVSQSVSATPAPQNITLSGIPASAVYGSMFTVGATGGASGNPVSFTSGGGCSNSGATYTMTSGTTACSVIANQAGNSNYSAATQASRSVSATPVAQSIILSGVPASAANGSMFTVGATGGASGNPVVFTSAGGCTNAGATYTMTSGTTACSVIANQAGNANYSAAPQVIRTVNATGGALLSISPTSFNLGTVDYNFDLDPAIITVKNIGTATANISNVSLTRGAGTNTADFTLINLCLSPLAPGKTCYISVIFFSGNLGPVSATVKITDNAPGSPQQVTLAANVIGFAPSSLNFGTIKVGKSSTQSVTLKNTGMTALKITGVNITGQNAHDFVKNSACPSSLAPNASCSVSVTFTPSAKGARSANLILNNNAPLGSLIAPLTGTGN